MLEVIRTHRRWMLFFILILILPSFVFFGIQGYNQMIEGDRAYARVAGRSITEAEVQDAQRRYFDELRRQSPKLELVVCLDAEQPFAPSLDQWMHVVERGQHHRERDRLLLVGVERHQHQNHDDQRDEGVEDDEQHRDAIDAHLVLDAQRLDPRHGLDELEAAVGPVQGAGLDQRAGGDVCHPAAQREAVGVVDGARRQRLARLWRPSLYALGAIYALSAVYIVWGLPGVPYPTHSKDYLAWREAADAVHALEQQVLQHAHHHRQRQAGQAKAPARQPGLALQRRAPSGVPRKAVKIGPM